MKNKKILYTIGIICLLTVIGGTIAYLQSTDTFENIFNAGTYKTVTHEEFTSPENWAPGDTISKSITTTNQGTIPVRVRVKLTESWASLDNSVLDNCVERSTELENYGDCLGNVAIINLANTEDWIKDGDYYYYVGELDPNETTSSLIQSVTFNPAYQGDVTCTTVNNVQTCESNSSGYSGGTYTLNITTETVQSDAYQSVWNLSYDPAEERTVYVDFEGNQYNTYEEANSGVFIKARVLGETLSNPELGYIYNDTEYYLKPGVDYYNENKTMLLNTLGSTNCEERIIPSSAAYYTSCRYATGESITAAEWGSLEFFKSPSNVYWSITENAFELLPVK